MLKNKNIAVFSRSTHYHFVSGGMETQLKNLLEGLSKAGFTLTVFTTSYPGKLDKDVHFSKNGVDYVFIKDTTPGLYPMTAIDKFWKKLGQLDRKNKVEGKSNYFEKSFEYFQRYNDKNPFDLIISQSTAGRGVVFETNIPSISIIHGTILAEIKNRFVSNKTIKNWIRFLFLDLPNWILEKATTNGKFFNKVNSVVSVSNNLKDQFLSEYPTLDDKVSVIYNGVDSKRFSPGKDKNNTKNKNNDNFTFLYIGRVDREKGVDLIIDATKTLLSKTKKKFKVEIVGTGIHLDELKKYSKKVGVEKIVKFIGSVDNEAINKYYKRADVFVFPTRREEGHPMTISESFCSGLPVIATKKGGLINVIKDGENGFLINEGDVDALADKMFELLENRNMASKMSKRALETGIKKYSQDVMILKYVNLIKGFK